MSWLWVVAVFSAGWLVFAGCALWLWSRRQRVDRVCAICDGPIDELEPWRWSRHLDAPVHYGCVPAILRAAGGAYVTVWLERGDSFRSLSEVAETEERAS